MSDPLPAVSVMGLGKLGSPMAACLAAKGYRVIGVDLDPAKVDAINAGRAPVREPRLQELIDASGSRLRASGDAAAAAAETDVTFIVVPTPSEPDGGFSVRFVLPVLEAIGGALRAKRGWHLVVLTSTVMPGTTGGIVRQTLEQASGKRAGESFGLCYSPEFVALGSVVDNSLRPDFVLIGESDERAGATLAGIYDRVCENHPPAARMNFVNAELAKLSVNTFVTTKITFSNMLARICEQLEGADVDVVTQALGLDSRIGRRYLKGAIAYGGPCFPRDNVALASLARWLGVAARVAEATDAANRDSIGWLAGIVQRRLAPGQAVALLGLSYKPHTDVIEESPALLLAQALLGAGIPVIAYDPMASAAAQRVLQGPVRFAASAEACVQGGDVVVLATPWPQFAGLGPDAFARAGRPRVVIDCWRLLDPARLGGTVEYIATGRPAAGAGAPAAARGRQPRVTIVMPSLNQARFLEEAIQSVLAQDYPNVEFIIIDGGSTDGSVDIIKKYADRLAHWVSEPDRGHGDALCKGFSRATGEILAWLNSDDSYFPGAIRRAVEAFQEDPSADLVYGDVLIVDEHNRSLGERRLTRMDWYDFLGQGNCLAQPAAFWTRRIYEQVGGIDASYYFQLDLDFFVRVVAAGRIKHLRERLASLRIHPEGKMVRAEHIRRVELERLRQQYVNQRPGRLWYSWQFLSARQLMWYTMQGDFGYAWRKVWHRVGSRSRVPEQEMAHAGQ